MLQNRGWNTASPRESVIDEEISSEGTFASRGIETFGALPLP
jgi:hypothetical protein